MAQWARTTTLEVGQESADPLARAVRKVAWRIIPFLVLAYLVNFLDKTSIGYAALEMNRTLGLSATQFGWGAGILFISYSFFEVPSNIAMYHYGARVWISRIMITWGIAAAANAFVVGPTSFYAVRFLLGAFEAGFFPGVIWYLSIWFPDKYRTRAMALFAAAAPLSQLVGGPISVSLMRLDGLWGVQGWQWMFIVEGLPAVILGIACLRILVDRPEEATWLSDEERTSLVDALASETRERPKKNLLAALQDVRVWLSAFIVFCYTVGSYGLGVWLPLILKEHQISTTLTGWLSAIPFLFATLSTLFLAYVVDRSGKKIYTLIFTLLLGIAGMIFAVHFNSLAGAVFWITIGLVGVISARMIFYTVPQVFLSGAAAAGGLGFINSLGALGGFVGPAMMGWLKDMTGSFATGMYGMAAILLAAIAASCALKLLVRNA